MELDDMNSTSVNHTAHNGSGDVFSWVHQQGVIRGDDPEFTMNGILIPVIGLCGVLGNILNLTILSWRCNKREVDVLERGALLGLIALAVSDLCFCLGLLPKFFFYGSKMEFKTKDFQYYFQVYGIYFQDVFIKISTWLTVIIATARYVAICHPLQARIFAGLFATKFAIIATYVFWFLILSPILWSYDLYHYQDKNNTNISFYLIDVGKFNTNTAMNTSFKYIWAFIGYFIPVAVLTFCNIKLIQALRESLKLRESSAHSAPSGRDANLRITSTLVALIVMFLVLVSPSELLHFYMDVMQSDSYPQLEMALICTNVLQTINFAFHFVLYCAVNGTFRRTLVNVFRRLMCKLRKENTARPIRARYTTSLARCDTKATKLIRTSVQTHV